jgi:carboxymethylenebutenolidase
MLLFRPTSARLLFATWVLCRSAEVTWSFGIQTQTGRESLSRIFSTLPPSVLHIVDHILSPTPSRSEFKALEDIANTRIPAENGSIEILAYVSEPKIPNTSPLPLLILIHEFFGLNESIQQKANELADDLQCRVVAPDTFRGVNTNFVPQAIWLALSTPQDRVNRDLNAVVEHYRRDTKTNTSTNTPKLAVMGFCYGGGKAIRYSIQEQPEAATVIFYGNPVTDANELQRLRAPVCAAYGRNDVQFPMSLLEQFQQSLQTANVDHDVKIYDGVGHAFWKDMDQIRRGDEPQSSAYRQCTEFLKTFFGDLD